MIKLYGKNLCLSALESPHSIESIIVSEDTARNHSIFFSELSYLSEKRNIKVSVKTTEFLRKISRGKPHKGCITLLNYIQPSNKELLLENGGYIYVYNSENDGNIGSIIRTAEVMGLTGIILPLNKMINETLIRTSAGAALHIKIYNLAIFQVIKLAKNRNFEVVGIERNGVDLEHHNFVRNTLMIIGGENKELKTNILDRCDSVVSIQQKGYTNSLNMSTAASIVMYNYSVQIR